MNAALQARLERRLRPLFARLPPRLAVALYSRSRRRFLTAFFAARPAPRDVPEALARTRWGLAFRSPLLNAAGLFKNGEGWDVALRQGAGAWLAGTTTHLPRPGNRRHGIAQPFAPYPRSAAASNWLGLPNRGHRAVAARLAELPRVEGVPTGASLAAVDEDAPDEAERLRHWIDGMVLYDEAGVDFLELNESCPNTDDDRRGFEALEQRLAHVAEHFLERRRRPLPVIVKLSCDTPPGLVPRLVDGLVELGFDGVNFGNTSTAYDLHRTAVAGVERPLYDHFRRAFGGGVSGRPLKAVSLALATAAVRHLGDHPPAREFHVVRTGGIETAADVRQSLDAGIAFCQWYSGYFEAFGRDGHDLYEALYRRL